MKASAFFILLLLGEGISGFHLPRIKREESLVNQLGKAGGAFLLTTILTLSPFTLGTTDSIPSASEIRNKNIPCFTKLSALALTENQILVDNVWKEVNRQYVDQTFNTLGEEGWRKERLKAVTKVSNIGPDEKEYVYSTIRDMLSMLGDPYTRFLSPDQFESLTAYARGGSNPSAGIGVQLIGDPMTGKIVVLNVIPEGPAAKGGVLPGDIILEIDHEDMSKATAEVVAAKCRGQMDTEVTLAIQHGSESSQPQDTVNVAIKRSQIKTTSVKASTFTSDSGKKVGLIKLTSFNLETEKLFMDALDGIRKTSSLSSLVIDLRGNAGGYMPAGVDVAKLFLPAQARVVSEIDKSGRSTIYVSDGIGSDTELPIYVLVDQRTASASEILTAALQDNHRATVVGTKTFGKGRIQNLQELQDGAGISVTKAKYITPLGKDIHGVGLYPDLSIETSVCGTNDNAKDCLKSVVL